MAAEQRDGFERKRRSNCHSLITFDGVVQCSELEIICYSKYGIIAYYTHRLM